MSGCDLPSPAAFHKYIGKPGFADDLTVLAAKRGRHAAENDRRFTLIEHLHFIDDIRNKLQFAGRLVKARDIFGFCRQPSAGIGKNKLVRLDPLKKRLVTLDVRRADVTLKLHQFGRGLARVFIRCLTE